MATLPASPESVLLQQRPKLWQPLVQVRRGIRRFIVSEVALQLALAVAIWFWASFLVDYGLFWLLGFDYVRDSATVGAAALRVFWWALLLGAFSYLIGYRLLYRLVVAFRPETLALVLERRFPHLLEERLVTAVELADPELARRYGYSYILVEYTAESAEQRLQQLPVREVFNWPWLARLGLVMLTAWLVTLALGYFATEWVATWWERNVLWQSRHWPVQVLLVLPDFEKHPTRGVPSGGEMSIRILARVNVVRTDHPDYPSGWRPATWDDLFPPEETEQPSAGDAASPAAWWTRERQRFWELQPSVAPPQLRAILPLHWQSLTLDEVEARHQAMSAQQLRAEALEHLVELGRAAVDYLLPRVEQRLLAATETERSLVRLDDELARWLPEAWRDWSLGEIRDHLLLARRMTGEEIRRRLQLLRRPVATTDEAALALLTSLSPVPVPYLGSATLQQLAWLSGWAAHMPPLTWTVAEWRDLPESWQALPAAELERNLQGMLEQPPLLALARAVNAQLGELFAELQRRADQRHWGRRIYFRRLRLFDQVTLEYEDILSEEERRRMRPQLERLPVNRSPGSFQYHYEFRRIERPRRFRVLAGDAVTPWYYIAVRPLPTFRQLWRWQLEPGHLHGSTDWVNRGPISVPTESGQESRFDAPIGSQITFLGQTTKTLESVEIGLQEERPVDLYAAIATHGLATSLHGDSAGLWVFATAALATYHHESRNPYVRQLVFSPGSDEFRVSLAPLGNEELRLVFRFTDTEGIRNTRRITIIPVSDKEPEFQYASFEIVRREAITPRAIIPFSALVRDDYGLTQLEYEVSVILPDGKPLGPPTRLPLRTFSPALPAPALDQLDWPGGDALARWTQPITFRAGTTGRTVARTLPLGTLGKSWVLPVATLFSLPHTGALALTQPPILEQVIEHECRYETRPISAPFLTGADEFLFTELIPREIEVPDPERKGKMVRRPLPPPYRLVVRLAATDNRMVVAAGDRLVSQPQRSYYHAAFEFNVVTENDLLIDVSRREEEIRERCDNLLAKLVAVRDQLVKMRQESEQLSEDLALRFARDTEDAQRQVRDGRDLVQREVIRELRFIHRELWFNRVQQKELDRLDEKICRPLEQLVRDGEAFDQAQTIVGLLAERLRTQRQNVRPADFDPAVFQMNFLIERFQKIIQEIKGLIEYAKALEILRDLIKAQEEINELLREIHKRRLKEELGNP